MSLSGGASNTNPAASLGGAKSSTAAVATTLFDAVTASEASAGRVEYRCVFITNADPALTAVSAVLSVQADSTSSSTALAVGLGTGAVSGTEPAVANETTAPSGVTFGTSANLGDLAAGAYRAVWIRRTVTAGAAALATDAANLRVTGSYTE